MHARHPNYADPAHGHGWRMPWVLVCRLRAEYRPHVRGHGTAALARKYRVARRAVELIVTYRARVQPPEPGTTTLWDMVDYRGRV